MIDKKLVDEIISLDALRVQNVFGLFNSIMVIELYSPINKRLFFVADHNPQNRTIHLQRDRPNGLKTKSTLVSLLNKYAVGQKLQFFASGEGETLKAIFVNNGIDFCLLIETFPKAAIGLFRGSELIASFKKAIAPVYRPGHIETKKKALDLEHNFAQAKIHAEKLLSFYQKKIFEQSLANLKHAMAKRQKLLKNLEQDLLKCQKNLALSHDAELVRNNLHLITRGMKEAILTDYSTDPPTKKTVPLDPSISPKDFLAKIFSKIKRAHRGIATITPRLTLIRDEMEKDKEALKEYELLGQKSITWKDLTKKTIIAPQKTQGIEKRLPYRTYLSSDDIKILVGRSAKDSDALTLHYARGNEWWFHAEDVRGAHVVVKSALPLPDNTFLEAVLLAHHFSKAREDSHATVRYTRIKNVKKPKGLAPGKVLISQEKTSEIKVDEKLLSALLARELKFAP